MIRISKHTTRFNNINKQNLLNEFIDEYKQAIEFYINHLFPLITYETYETPKFISTKHTFPNNTKLSQRALKCAATQACGMINAQTAKPRKVIYTINKLQKENKDVSNLQKWLSNYKFSKPKINDNYKCELNSICCDLKQSKNFLFLQLKSLGKYYGKIRIPLKQHKRSNKWKAQGITLNSFLVSKNYVDIRYEIETSLKEEGKVVGADQGKNTCLSLSDGQVTKTNKHGYDLNSILDLMSKRVKGSKGFKRCQEHRKNYINWSINQLNFQDIKKINLERLKDVRRGKSNSRLMSHWTYTLIKDKLVRVGEEQKVFVVEQSCVYRSQRCNQCGMVRKSNRIGKLYCCNSCGYVGDADINASLNHEIDLPDVDYLRGKNYNLEGFYWKPSGVYDFCHEEITVPHTIKL